VGRYLPSVLTVSPVAEKIEEKKRRTEEEKKFRR